MIYCQGFLPSARSASLILQQLCYSQRTVSSQHQKSGSAENPKDCTSVNARGQHRRYQMDAENFQQLKSRTRCNKSNKYGHWTKDLMQDGKLKPEIKSMDKLGGSTHNRKDAITFNMENLE